MVTRRDFMRATAGLAVGAAVGLGAQPSKKTKVVLIRRKEAWEDDHRLSAKVIQEMIDEAVLTLTGESDPAKAFRVLVKPGEVVGIKTNSWRFLPTPAEVETAIRRRLVEAGIKEESIGIDDRGVRGNPVFQNATALINARPLRTHFWAGIGGCIKNYITFTPTPSDYHPDSCADLALIWKLPAVAGKTRLNVLSVLNPLFHGRGPHHFDRRYVWNYSGLIVGTDVVAVDAVGLELIKKKRVGFFGRERELQTSPKHVASADVKHGLGVSDLAKIDLVKLGWQEGILI